MSNQGFFKERERGEDRGPQGGPGGPRRFFSHPRVCQFCTDRSVVIDYKNAELLKRFVSEDGKIRPRRQTGTCAKHQREITTAIKRARHLALLPFTGETLR